MQLYFFRHALAEIASVGQTDADRKLTQEGIDRTRQSARLLKLLDLTPIKLYTSPLVRAKQTADILGHTLESPIEVRRELAPGFNLAALTALVSDLALDDSLIVVGHEPDFSRTISALTGGSQIVMKKGGLARVDITSMHPLSGELVWLIAPKVFQKLG
ncbi:MAG: phosphohistidine phosphatase SixA [Chloroflexi bacterium]|nr:phosphohistidine phosphatase SixA [Chloroflexota bacterium]